MTHINWIAYYHQTDGYGRFNSRMVQALQEEGISVKAATMDSLHMPSWLQEQEHIDWDGLTISCMPPYFVKSVPGQHWLFSMTEGSELPKDWVETVNESNVERVIVPCPHNAKVFRNSGIRQPVSVVPGGTDPDEFPVVHHARPEGKPYTFLTIADRGARKGWEEVWEAFYIAFGGKTTGLQDVNLVIKSRPKEGVTLPSFMSSAEDKDKRIIYRIEDVKDMAEVYSMADVLALPSRCEGWGMPHREAAMMGVPVITQQYSGLDDGHTWAWAIVVEGGKLMRVPKEHKPSVGEWMVVDVDALADVMYRCYKNQEATKEVGLAGAKWLRENQTWQHAAVQLINLIQEKTDAHRLGRRALSHSY